jgi:hypothetical protein
MNRLALTSISLFFLGTPAFAADLDGPVYITRPAWRRMSPRGSMSVPFTVIETLIMMTIIGIGVPPTLWPLRSGRTVIEVGDGNRRRP